MTIFYQESRSFLKFCLPVVLALILLSCNEAKPTSFNKHGVSFSCPADWAITEEENMGDGSYYISIEKNGFTSSGLYTITWVKDSVDLVEYLNVFKDELKNNIIFKNSNLNFTEPITNNFNSFQTVSSNYTANLISVKHHGIIHTFHCKNRSYAILKQEAAEDSIKNKEGFISIEKSFKIK